MQWKRVSKYMPGIAPSPRAIAGNTGGKFCRSLAFICFRVVLPFSFGCLGQRSVKHGFYEYTIPCSSLVVRVEC